MCLTGSLIDFPLLEILQLIERGQKTGLLTLFAAHLSAGKPLPIFYIWVYRGRLVTAAKRLDNRGLVQIINKSQWIAALA